MTREYLGMSQVAGSDLHMAGNGSMIENSEQKYEPSSLLLLNNGHASLDEGANKLYRKNRHEASLADFLDDHPYKSTVKDRPSYFLDRDSKPAGYNSMIGGDDNLV